MSGLKDKARATIASLPDNKLTHPIKERMEKDLDDELTAAQQEVQKKIWELNMAFRELKQMLDDPQLPEEKKAALTKTAAELDAKLNDWQSRLQEMREKKESDS